MPTDPAPFLSTVILASAGLVAIMGGLLVARFVGLDSDQQTSRKLLADASDRLEIARRRAVLGRANLTRWNAQDLLDENDVAEALAGGLADIARLRRLAATELDDDELRTVISQAADDVQALRSWLSPVLAMDRIRAAGYAWENYARGDMPALNYRQLAAPVFAQIADWLQVADAERERRAEDERRELARRFPQDYPAAGGSSLTIPRDFEALTQIDAAPSSASQVTGQPLTLTSNPLLPAGTGRTTHAGRDGDLIETSVRTSQRVEDLEEELRRLRQQHALVVRPYARLWWFVGILTAYAIAGVAVPLWVMAQGPASIAAVRWIFWLFAGGLAVLLISVIWYLADLIRGRGPGFASTATVASTTAEPARARTVRRAAAPWQGTLDHVGRPPADEPTRSSESANTNQE